MNGRGIALVDSLNEFAGYLRGSKNAAHVYSSARKAAAITPDDAGELDYMAVWVGTGGTLVVRMVGDTGTVSLTNIPNGTWVPVHISRVMLTGTTAAGIIGFNW